MTVNLPKQLVLYKELIAQKCIRKVCAFFMSRRRTNIWYNISKIYEYSVLNCKKYNALNSKLGCIKCYPFYDILLHLVLRLCFCFVYVVVLVHDLMFKNCEAFPFYKIDKY